MNIYRGLDSRSLSRGLRAQERKFIYYRGSDVMASKEIRRHIFRGESICQKFKPFDQHLSFAVGVGCLALGYFLGKQKTILALSAAPDTVPYHGKEETHEVEELADKFEDFKMVLVVRNDLKMGRGKVAAQCSHATLGLYKKIFYRAPKTLQRWEMCSQVKVVTKVESEEEMIFLQDRTYGSVKSEIFVAQVQETRAKTMKLPCHITVDAGRTQIAPNSKTVIAIVGPRHLVDEITGSLKLL